MQDFVFLLRFWTARPCHLPHPARRKASVPQDPRPLAKEVDDRGKKVGIEGGIIQAMLPFGDHPLELSPSYPRSSFGGGHGGGRAVRNGPHGIRHVAMRLGALWYL